MEAIAEFFTMGGYAVYVWPSYAVTAVVLIGMLVSSLRLLKTTEDTFNTLKSEKEARMKRQEADEA